MLPRNTRSPSEADMTYPRQDTRENALHAASWRRILASIALRLGHGDLLRCSLHLASVARISPCTEATPAPAFCCNCCCTGLTHACSAVHVHGGGALLGQLLCQHKFLALKVQPPHCLHRLRDPHVKTYLLGEGCCQVLLLLPWDGCCQV